MNFLIQTIDTKVKHDFSFTLIESCDYQNWYHNDVLFQCVFSDTISQDSKLIPIGSVEFVIEYLKLHFGLEPKPKNIPIDLLRLDFTGRNIFNGTEKDVCYNKFVKSNDKIKAFTGITSVKLPAGNYQISDLIDIQSEWRAFIYKGQLVGLNNYSGDFDVFPDVSKLKLMISAYVRGPIAYTLDVAISNNNTVIIEVHDFFSCGLYGFADHRILPFMFSDWFYSFIKTNGKNI
jgi:hypothetical protein